MSEHLDNVDIEVTIKVMQKSGWNDENVLGEAKRQSKGTITLESIPGIVSSTATECANAVINQFGITCAI
ncbi:MAG: hypothetical protein GY906_23665, partial [bacterium]|nr:hypothetical protein [bacterium]